MATQTNIRLKLLSNDKPVSPSFSKDLLFAYGLGQDSGVWFESEKETEDYFGVKPFIGGFRHLLSERQKESQGGQKALQSAFVCGALEKTTDPGNIDLGRSMLSKEMLQSLLWLPEDARRIYIERFDSSEWRIARILTIAAEKSALSLMSRGLRTYLRPFQRISPSHLALLCIMPGTQKKFLVRNMIIYDRATIWEMEKPSRHKTSVIMKIGLLRDYFQKPGPADIVDQAVAQILRNLGCLRTNKINEANYSV